jgi:hypothetical protein
MPTSSPIVDVQEQLFVDIIDWLRGVGYLHASNALAELHATDRALRRLPPLTATTPPPVVLVSSDTCRTCGTPLVVSNRLRYPDCIVCLQEESALSDWTGLNNPAS